MKILGISALYHDAAASLIIDGKIIASVQEERFSRVKHDLRFPENAIRCCLEIGGIDSRDLDMVVFYDNPLLTIDRYISNVHDAGVYASDVIKREHDNLFSDKLWIHNLIRNKIELRDDVEIYVCEHHMSHAASAFYPSPFKDAIVLTVDGVGEWATTTIGIGHDMDLNLVEEIRYPHSLGLFYSAFTYFCGFKVNYGDYKFMGLAPYGEPIYEDLIREKIIDVKEDGSYRLNLDYFDYQYGRTMINSDFEELFGGPRREPESKITKREMDIAASVQKILEDVILKIAKHAKIMYGSNIDNLVLAGGVALNCVANGKLKNKNIFKNIWIQPAAGDAGGSLGCALYAAYHKGDERMILPSDAQKGSYLGNSYTSDDVKTFLDEGHFAYHFFNSDELYDEIANELCSQKVIGLFQGRMEFGPRALGCRSIIADARSEEMQTVLNLKIKYRESFRPFAPIVLLDDVDKYFELKDESPYMLVVENVLENRRIEADVKSLLESSSGDMLSVVRQRRSDIPAVTHVDYSARIQTVTEERNDYLYKVLLSFKEKTGCSVLVNTSFNVRGEPIVCSLQDAYECFMRTEMDILVLENYILYKSEQPEWKEKENWKAKYTLD